MIAALPLKKMSIQEKISTMEYIWDDLCKNAGDITSPEWHKDILDDREKTLKARTDSFVDWEDAKRKIRKNIK
ncbi:MAG TPA: addiction module antitoxin RelB [Lentisphaeria bacterium]|nr:MAG: hypothetical protein A2X45_17675 [Lentisphaerae bacterium GWF2_50_93]HCE43169.1 addiction module antitoxin RelB [Lentisphaeria bacterium]